MSKLAYRPDAYQDDRHVHPMTLVSVVFTGCLQHNELWEACWVSNRERDLLALWHLYARHPLYLSLSMHTIRPARERMPLLPGLGSHTCAFYRQQTRVCESPIETA